LAIQPTVKIYQKYIYLAFLHVEAVIVIHYQCVERNISEYDPLMIYTQ